MTDDLLMNDDILIRVTYVGLTGATSKTVANSRTEKMGKNHDGIPDR